MRDLGKRVGLVHELRQLAGAEKLLDRRGDRFGVDQVMRHERFDLLQGHPLLDRPLHAHQAHAVLVLAQFADCPHPAVAEVVDVVAVLEFILDADQVLDTLDDVFLGQGAHLDGGGHAEFGIDLVPADFGEVIGGRAEKQVVEKGSRHLEGWWAGRTQPPVDFDQGLVGILDLIQQQGLAERVRVADAVDEQQFKGRDTGVGEVLKHLGGDRIVAPGHNFAGGLVDHILGEKTTMEVFLIDGHGTDAQALDFFGEGLGDFFAFPGDHRPVDGTDDIGGQPLAGKGQRIEGNGIVVTVAVDNIGVIKFVEQFLISIAQGLEQHADRQFTAAVDADVENVFDVEFEIEPGTAHRDDSGGVQPFA